nr:AI-2E family transporter [Actinopolymorpha pittospori]
MRWRPGGRPRPETGQEQPSSPPTPPRPRTSPSYVQRAATRTDVVPRGLLVASEWSWRLILVAIALLAIAYVLIKLGVVVVPVLIAILITALLEPLTNLLARAGVRRSIAAGLTLLLLIVVILGLLALVGQQIALGYRGLAKQVVGGVEEIRVWLVRGPFHVSEGDINRSIQSLRRALSTNQLTQGALQITTTLAHVVAGTFIALFSTFFFLFQGNRIWRFVLHLFPRAAQEDADGAARRGWVSLTAYVRATVLVALVDAVGITIVAVVLRVPFAFAIGVLVFLGAFIPIVGATLSGAVAVVVALVARGPLIALLMLAGVLLVQQIEAHLLQPFLMGRFVRLHPLAILLAIAAGGYLAGIVGALFAVPTVAVLNGVVRHLVEDVRSRRDAAIRAGPPAAGG